MKARTMNFLKEVIQNFPDLAACEEDIEQTFHILKQAYINKGKLLVCGNGGSSADSDHIVGELMKGFLLKRKIPNSMHNSLVEEYGDEAIKIANSLQQALPAISLSTHTALLTAYLNDMDAEMIFAQQVYGYGREGDILLAISTSGNSKNVLHAVKTANIMKMKTVALTGKDGGILKDLCDISIIAPANETNRIQEFHVPIYHTLCAMLEEEFFGV